MYRKLCLLVILLAMLAGTGCSATKTVAFSWAAREGYAPPYVVPVHEPVKVVIQTNEQYLTESSEASQKLTSDKSRNLTEVKLYSLEVNEVLEMNPESRKDFNHIHPGEEISPDLPLQVVDSATSVYVEQLDNNLVVQGFDGRVTAFMIALPVPVGFATADYRMSGTQMNDPGMKLGREVEAALNGRGIKTEGSWSNRAHALVGCGPAEALTRLKKCQEPSLIYVGLHAPWFYLPGAGGYAVLVGDVVHVSAGGVSSRYRIVVRQGLDENIKGFQDISGGDMAKLKQILDSLEKDFASVFTRVFNTKAS